VDNRKKTPAIRHCPIKTTHISNIKKARPR
jgi:hypothetical protein